MGRTMSGRVVGCGAVVFLVGCGGGESERFETSATWLFPSADCSTWSLTGGTWHGPIDVLAVAVLQRSDGAGGWIDTCESVDYRELGDRTTIDWSAAYPHEFSGSFACTIPSGSYRVSLTASYFSIYDASAPIAVLRRSYPAAGESFVCSGTSSFTNRTPGYWKNHASAWPTDSLSIGGVSYTKACLLAFFDVPTRGDIRVKLIHHLVAAKLNLLSGADGASIGTTVADADAYLAASRTRLRCGDLSLEGSARDRRTAERLKDALDAFNNGR